MATVNIWTYKDVLEHLMDYMGEAVATIPSGLRDARRAAQAAYRELAHAHPWHYYYQPGRIVTVASQTTGTIAYTHTGGAYERVVTLTGATWPSWAAYGVLVINNIAYTIAERKSDTQITLSINTNPGANVASGTAYTLYRDSYPLPIDFIAAQPLHSPSNWGGLCYVHPRDWLFERSLTPTVGTPVQYTFSGSDSFLGILTLRLYPAPSAAATIDFVYQRRPRQLLIEEYKTGTVAVLANATTLTGTGTAWTSSMVGSIINLSADGVNEPTGLTGDSPYLYQRVIVGWTSATSITVDTAIPTALTGVKYRIADPIDLEGGVMMTAYLRGCEAQLAITRNMKSKMDAQALYLQALHEAKAADSRTLALRGVGWLGGYRRRYADMPLGADS